VKSGSRNQSRKGEKTSVLNNFSKTVPKYLSLFSYQYKGNAKRILLPNFSRSYAYPNGAPTIAIHHPERTPCAESEVL